MPHYNPEQIEDEALAWLMRTTSGNITPQQQQGLSDWLSQSAAHRSAFEAAQNLWQGLGELRERPLISKNRIQTTTRVITPEKNTAQQQNRYANRPVLPQRMTLAVAACLALLAVLVGANSNVWRIWQAEYHTATGEQQTIVLSDGSTVYLNSGSALDPDYSPEQRRINLLEGEAEFVVSKDKNRPFIVVADGQEIKALGTDFIVRKQQQGVSVTVVESSVQVSHPDLSAITPVVLYPGEHLISKTGQQPGPITTVDLGNATSWRFNRLIFESESLDKVIAEINRYRNGHVFLGRPSLASYRVSGVFNINELGTLLTVINKTLPVKSVALSERYIVLY